MPISRAKKEASVADLTDRFERCESAVFVDYRGLTVAEMQAIRRELRSAGCDLLVAKNRLIRLALAATGRSLVASNGKDCTVELTKGLTAVSFSYDLPGSAAEALLKLSRTYEEIEFKGGFFGREPVVGRAGVERISKMRSKVDALADLVRILKGGPSRVRLVASAAPLKLKALKQVLETEAA